jgi:nucleoside-diphosphate-sugar epimerase
MRVFVAGATGAIGVRLIPLLIAQGHDVAGLTRTPAKTELLRGLGARPFVGDALDEAAVSRILAEAKPEVVVHQLTSLSGANDLRKFDRAFALSNRLRTQGLDSLLAAARKVGAHRIVVQSFCGWPYARSGGPVKSEDDPLDPNPPREFALTLAAIRHLESVALNPGADMEGVALRYGAFYGPGTGVFDGPMIDQLRRRRAPLIGAAAGWWSFVHVQDAAEATVAAIEASSLGLFNVSDDDPAPVSQWLPALAEMLGAKPPLRVPQWLARLLAGEHIVTMMTEARAGSNAKAKRELAWRPSHPSWRTGFVEVVKQMGLA